VVAVIAVALADEQITCREIAMDDRGLEGGEVVHARDGLLQELDLAEVGEGRRAADALLRQEGLEVAVGHVLHDHVALALLVVGVGPDAVHVDNVRVAQRKEQRRLVVEAQHATDGLGAVVVLGDHLERHGRVLPHAAVDASEATGADASLLCHVGEVKVRVRPKDRVGEPTAARALDHAMHHHNVLLARLVERVDRVVVLFVVVVALFGFAVRRV